MRYWVPKVLSSSGRERLTKNDPDYWLGSRQILKAATTRFRALKPLIELLAVPNFLAESAMAGAGPSPVTEAELGTMQKALPRWRRAMPAWPLAPSSSNSVRRRSGRLNSSNLTRKPATNVESP